MLKIGITGGIGSGKTTVSRIFHSLGIPVFYSDIEAKRVMINDRVLVSEVIAAFGKETYFEDGRLNNKYLANIVFKKESELEKLNAIVHPAVFRAFDCWVKLQDPRAPYLLKEAALLFESGSYKKCDYCVLVLSPEDIRIRRVMERDLVSIQNVRNRMNKQFTDERKMELADFVIHNDEQNSLIGQIWKLHQAFLLAAGSYDS